MRTRTHSVKVALLVLLLVGATGACVESPAKYDAASKKTSAAAATHTKSTQAPGHDTVSIKVLEKAIAKTKSVTTGHFSAATESKFKSTFGSSAGFSCTAGDKECVPMTEDSSAPTTTLADDWMEKHHPTATPEEGTTGVFDRAHDRASLDLVIMAIDQAVVDGDHSYMHMTKGTKKSAPWVEIPTSDLKKMAALFLGGVNPTDPMDILQDVKLIDSTATVVGSERLAGTPVVHYSTSMNLTALNNARRLPDPSLALHFTDMKVESPDADNVPVDLWIDKEGVVRRIWWAASYDSTMTYRQKSSPNDPPQTSTSHLDEAVDLMLTHPGEPVEIMVPKPSQVSPVPPGGFAAEPS